MMATLSALGAVILALITPARALTPEEMLSTNQYSPAIPNPTGEFALIYGGNVTFNNSAVVGGASFWNLLNLTTGAMSTWALDSPISEIVFVGPDPTSILYIDATNATTTGSIALYTADVFSPESATLVASLPAPYAGLKAGRADNGAIKFLLYGLANPDGSAYNPVLAELEAQLNPGASSARIYDSTYTRVYDHWRTEQRYAVFGGTLTLNQADGASYSFDGQLTNFVTGICDVTCAESPIDAGLTGGTSSVDYDISPDGSLVAFNTKDVGLPLANYSSTQIYLVDFNGTARDAAPVNPRDPSSSRFYPEAQGASSYPVFSPDGTMLAYLQADSIVNPSDRNRIYVAEVPSAPLGQGQQQQQQQQQKRRRQQRRGQHPCPSEEDEASSPSSTPSPSPSTSADPDLEIEITRLAGNWDRSPLYVGWSSDSRWLWAGTPHLGGGPAFAVPVTAGDDYLPANLTSAEGTLLGARALPGNELLVTDSKIWTPCDVYRVVGFGGDGGGVTGHKTLFEAYRADPLLVADGLGPADVSQIWYPSNTTDFEQQAWVVYPRGFDPWKKYPLALLTHGGPEAATFGFWGFLGQFNMKVWADQGYVVVAPNPTGSWGFGQNFTDAVYGRWGTLPYWDLAHCFRYVEAEMPFVDTTRAIHAGASFGGFMSNWIQGQEMGRWFKALVTHDGLTSTNGGQMATDQLAFAFNDFLGPLNETAFETGNPYHDFNPLLYVDKWATPHFVVHSSMDYRLPVAEGLALFNLLQQQGVPSRFLNFPDESHILTGPANQLVWHEEIFKWINYYSGIDDKSP